jgi:hypothetical protein
MKNLLFITLSIVTILTNGVSAKNGYFDDFQGDSRKDIILVCEDRKLRPYLEHAKLQLERTSPVLGFKQFEVTIIDGKFCDWFPIRDKAIFVRNIVFLPSIAGLTSFVGYGSIVRINQLFFTQPSLMAWWYAGYLSKDRNLNSYLKYIVLHELGHSSSLGADYSDGRDSIMDYQYDHDYFSNSDWAELIYHSYY